MITAEKIRMEETKLYHVFRALITLSSICITLKTVNIHNIQSESLRIIFFAKYTHTFTCVNVNWLCKLLLYLTPNLDDFFSLVAKWCMTISNSQFVN